MDKQTVKVVSCGAIPWRERDGRVELLLIKQFKNNDAWSIAKGHIKDDECIEDCAIREVKEETGIDVLLEKRLPDAVVNIKGGTKTVVAFLARPAASHEPNIEDPDCEVADAKWFDVESLPELQFYQRDLIESAAKMVKDMNRMNVKTAT